MQRFEGPRCLFLEDTCGSSLDALGYNCHSSQEEQLGPEIACLPPFLGHHSHRLHLQCIKAFKLHCNILRLISIHSMKQPLTESHWLAPIRWSFEGDRADFLFTPEAELPSSEPRREPDPFQRGLDTEEMAIDRCQEAWRQHAPHMAWRRHVGGPRNGSFRQA